MNTCVAHAEHAKALEYAYTRVVSDSTCTYKSVSIIVHNTHVYNFVPFVTFAYTCIRPL